MKIELHAIQNFAPSCLNRDDTNSPKDCEFGGYRRARISSQCLKHAIRWSLAFKRTIDVEIGARSRRALGPLTDEVVERGVSSDKARDLAWITLRGLIGDFKDSVRTDVAFYYSRVEMQSVAEFAVANKDALLGIKAKYDKAKGDEEPKTAAKDLQKLVHSLVNEICALVSPPDIALFGRMIAKTTDLKIDAACQVAHAISTHKASMEMDFFTAVDDLQPDEEPGAGMMGTVEFNSSCFYRYALIDWEQLVKNLDGDEALAARTVDGFMRAFVQAIPNAKQNSMAAQNPPSFVMAVVRENGAPCSLANAFERPVRPDERKGKGLVDVSIEALDAYWGAVNAMYGCDGIKAKSLCCLGEPELTHLAGTKTGAADGVYDAVMAAIGAAEDGEDA